MTKKFFQITGKILWACFLICLPFTNFRYFPTFSSASRIDVRPLYILPLFLLSIVFIIPDLWKRKLPKIWIPYLVFILMVLISSSLPIIQGFNSHIVESSVWARTIRAIITLLISSTIFLTVSLFPRNEDDLKFSLKWFYAGLVIALFWGILQSFYVMDLIPGWFQFMQSIQEHITTLGGTPDRIIGFTLEPSWFADQLAAMWLPWLFPAVLMNKTVYKRRWGWLTVEMLYTAALFFVLVLTLSRSGYLVALVMILCGVFLKPKSKNLDNPLKKITWINRIRERLIKIPLSIRVMATILVILILGTAVLYVASQQSVYIFRIFEYWLPLSGETDYIGNRSLGGYFRYIGFGPRFVYWETAYRVFAKHPIFGVGLGNFTFHFQEMLPAVQLGHMPELIRRFVPGPVRIVTAKSFFARLLAETGIAGTTVFLSFLVSLGGAGIYLWLSDDPEKKFWGIGSLLSIIAFLVDTFSYDSLAIPNSWVVFGLITAAFSVYNRSGSSKGGYEE